MRPGGREGLRFLRRLAAVRPLIPWAVLALLAVAVYFWGLGRYGLIDPDEGRYAEIPREMIESGDFVTPRLNYVKYFEKPALHYWLTAASFAAFGQNEAAARLFPVLFGLGGCLLTFVAARRMTGSARAGAAAAAVLVSSVLWYALSRLNVIDMTLTFFFTLAMLGYWLWVRGGEGAGRRPLLLFYAAMALATLSKGLIGVVLPGGIAVLHLASLRRWRAIPRLFSPWGIALYFAIVLPWFRAVCAANPDFFDFFFVHEHFTRYLTTEHGRYEPFWFFVPILLGGLVPWTGMLWDAFRAARGRGGLLRREDGLFLSLWFAVPLAFFSLSGSKLVPYVLPCLPPLAVLIGAAVEGILRGGAPAMRAGRRFACLNVLVLLPIVLAGAVYPALRPEDAYLRAATNPFCFVLTAFCLASFVLLRARTRGFLLLCLLALTALFVAGTGFDLMAARDSRRPIAAMLRERLRADDTVVAYGDLMQGLSFYLGRRIAIAGGPGELDFGAAQEEDPRWFLNAEQLRRLWNGPDRVLLAASRRRLEELTRDLGREPVRLGETEKEILFTNF